MITTDLVVSWDPCSAYTRERLDELSGGCAMSVLDVLLLPIPGADRLWAVLRQGVLPDSILREFATMCADIALSAERDAGREPDQRSFAAVECALRYAAGDASEDELRAAAYAAADAAAYAYAAAYTSANGAAYAAAGAAAAAAAYNAAYAADAAAYAADADAAYAAARDIECELLYALCVERGVTE
jgi:hypothetical protein